MSNDLIHEVEESIKQERLERLWKEYGGTLIAAAVLAVVITAGVTAYRNWNSRVNISQTTAVIEALGQDDQVAAIDQIAATLRPDQRAVATLTAAGILARDGKAEEALAHYKQAANDRDIEPIFRDLAGLMAARLEWTMAKPDLNPQLLLGTLATITDKKDSPWRYHAHMQAAVILAHAYENYSEARDHLAVITSATDLPSSLQERASALAHVYGLKMADASRNNTKEEPEG